MQMQLGTQIGSEDGDITMADEHVTYTCWSMTMLYRSEHNDDCFRTIIHMQGFHVGKDTTTACGIRSWRRLKHRTPFDKWNYESVDVHPSQWRGCRRCEAAYRVHVKRLVSEQV